MPERLEGWGGTVTTARGRDTCCRNSLFLGASVRRSDFLGCAGFSFDFMCSSTFLDFTESVEIESRVGIDIVHCVSSIRSLGDEEDDGDTLQSDEGEEDVKVVIPSKIRSNDTSDDGNTEVSVRLSVLDLPIGDCSKHKVDERNSNTPLMDKEEIADSGDDDRLISTGRESGDDTRCEKGVVIGGGHSNDGSNDTKDRRYNKHWAFTPFGGKSRNERSSRTDDEEIISGKLSNCSESRIEFDRKRD